MEKKKRLQNLGESVKGILEKHPQARDDDFMLYAYVLNTYGLTRFTTFWDIRKYVQQSKIPSMESVGRARRKCQELYPALRATPQVAEGRMNQIPEYEEFATVNKL